MLRPSFHHHHQSPTEYLETQLQSPVTAREAGYSLAFRTQARSVQDAYLDSAATPTQIIQTGNGRQLDRQAVPSFRQQQDRVLPSIEGPTHHLEPSTVHRDHNGFSTRPIEPEVRPHPAQQNLPILIRSGHSPVRPRIIELDEYVDNQQRKRRRITDLAYRQSNPVSAVTSQMAQTDVSDKRSGRVEWVESDFSSRRPQRDRVHLYELEPGFHNQRNGTHRRVQTTMEPTYHHEPSFRSMNIVDTDQQYWEPYHVVSRSTHGELARDVGYQSGSSGQRVDRTQILLRSGAAQLPTHRTEQCPTSFSVDRLPTLHEADQNTYSTQLLRAWQRDEDHTNVYPMYSADSRTNTNPALHYVRISEGDQSGPIYINESVQVTAGDKVRREASTRDVVVGAKEYVRYERTPEDEHFAGRAYPIYRRSAADPTRRPPALAAELRQIENDRPPLSHKYTYENPRKNQALFHSYRNNVDQQALSEEVSTLPDYIPLRAEQRR